MKLQGSRQILIVTLFLKIFVVEMFHRENVCWLVVPMCGSNRGQRVEVKAGSGRRSSGSTSRSRQRRPANIQLSTRARLFHDDDDGHRWRSMGLTSPARSPPSWFPFAGLWESLG